MNGQLANLFKHLFFNGKYGINLYKIKLSFTPSPLLRVIPDPIYLHNMAFSYDTNMLEPFKEETNFTKS